MSDRLTDDRLRQLRSDVRVTFDEQERATELLSLRKHVAEDCHKHLRDWCYPRVAQYALDPWIDREATA